MVRNWLDVSDRLLMLVWRSHAHYKSISIEWLRREYKSVGGMTWREFRTHRQQERETSSVARAEHEAKSK